MIHMSNTRILFKLVFNIQHLIIFGFRMQSNRTY